MDKISVVVPVYNAQKYVAKCIQSILNQDYPNLEVILVNDGSKDGSLAILNKFQNQYPDIIKVVDKPNGGVDWARRIGLDNVTGKWVMFVDSDDSLEPNAIVSLYNLATKHNVDMVSGCFNRDYGFYKRPVVNHASKWADRVISHPEAMDDLYISFFGISRLNVSMCGKLYRSGLFNKWKPTGLRFGEDLTTNMIIFPDVEKLYVTNEAVYNYRIGGGTGHYMPYLLANVKSLYAIKREQLKRIGYKKGVNPILYELKNGVRTHLQQVVLYGKANDSQWLKEEFADPIYQDFKQLFIPGFKAQNELDDAIYHLDAEKTWFLINKQFNRNSFKNIFKRLLAHFA